MQAGPLLSSGWYIHSRCRERRTELSVHEILENDHKELASLLTAAIRACDRSDHNTIYSRVDYFWARLAMHIRAEHLHLFPAVHAMGLGAPEIDQALETLRHDHDAFMHDLSRLISSLRKAQTSSAGTVVGVSAGASLRRIRAALAEHDRLEETLIYPLFQQAHLSETQQDRLVKNIKKELANLPQRFRNKTVI